MDATAFAWDADRDAANQVKHGVSFAEAQFAFADPARVIARDLEHSGTEDRFYCFGKLPRACSASVSLIPAESFESLAPASGAEEKLSMNKKTVYTNEPLGKIEVIPDFLPSPERLAFREEGVKVTLALSKRSVEFFKSEASKHSTQYQRMIRRLLDAYVDVHFAQADEGVRSKPRVRKRTSV